MEIQNEYEDNELQFDADGAGEPVRMVKTVHDMQFWTHSQAYYDLMGFINGISTAIQGKRITDDIYVSPTMLKLLEIINKLNVYIDETPPIDQPQRFGNKAYRSWSRKMNRDIFLLLQDAIPQNKCQYITELGFYICESFGNAVRIDYGTGHELSFIFFMCGLFKAKILQEADNLASALRLFNAYLLLVRRLQMVYRMEPAGSQGVWSLDDFQFIPFIWGSAQLAHKSPFDPPKFLDENIINEYKNDYMFISCIDYISKVKTGHFAEHSNQLWSISAVPSWAKINSGLVKMYQKEILSKYPIIQHVYFGRLMKYDSVEPGVSIPNARLGHLPTSARSSTQMPPPSTTTTTPPNATGTAASHVESATAASDDGPAEAETTKERGSVNSADF